MDPFMRAQIRAQQQAQFFGTMPGMADVRRLMEEEMHRAQELRDAGPVVDLVCVDGVWQEPKRLA